MRSTPYYLECCVSNTQPRSIPVSCALAPYIMSEDIFCLFFPNLLTICLNNNSMCHSDFEIHVKKFHLYPLLPINVMTKQMTL